MQQFIAADGASIAYEDIGSGRPLVLLHGLMANRGFFPHQRALADGFRLILVDLRGHGESDPARADTGVETLADDVAALVEQLSLEDAIGIGWSLGAAVMWHVLGGRASARFSAAVVIDMTARVGNGEGWDLGLDADICDARSQAIRTDFRAFATGAGRAIFARPRAEAEWAAAEFARSDPASIAAIWASLTEQDFRCALGTVHQHSLIVHGAHSHLYGAETAEYLAAALPSARLLRFERSGHAPHIEEPELFNQAIQEFAAALPLTSHQKTTA